VASQGEEPPRRMNRVDLNIFFLRLGIIHQPLVNTVVGHYQFKESIPMVKDGVCSS
jgi:hypothetical protein